LYRIRAHAPAHIGDPKQRRRNDKQPLHADRRRDKMQYPGRDDRRHLKPVGLLGIHNSGSDMVMQSLLALDGDSMAGFA
jgi:hypothetical protein